MVEQIIKDLRLSNLNSRRLRDSKCLFYMDENCGPNNIEEYKIAEMKRKNRVSLGKNFYDKDFINKIKDEDFQKVNHLKENRLPQPYRDYENYVNPISHFLTPGYDKSDHRGINPLVIDEIKEKTPQNTDPKDIDSDRLNCPNVFEEINRKSESDPRTLGYNNRIKSADACRAHLALKEKIRLINEIQFETQQKRKTFLSNAFPEFFPKATPDATDTDLKALKYLYTSTTQKAYEDIPFDSYLHPRRWAPVSTIETHPDPIRAAYAKKKCYPSVDSWRKNVNLEQFESEQLRPDHFLLKRPHDFCSPNPRGSQIPTYSGCIGAYNKEDIDNPNVKDFKPFTVLRSDVPKFADCTEKPVFVGYTGKIPILPGNKLPPFNTDPIPRNVLGLPC